MLQRSTRFLIVLALGLLSASTALAAPPDLTAPGVIAGIDRADTYNLGATGLRGWIWVDRNNKGDVGQITDPSRQILVTHCDAPANAVLAVDDVILGAIAASSGTVPDFTSDCRKAFAAAITDAEKSGAGTLRVKRWRAGTTTDVNITIPTLGTYSATAPFNCPKSSLILDNVRNKMVADLLANPGYLTYGFGGSSNALALLSGVKPGDPDYNTVQTRLQSYARSLANQGPLQVSIPIWDWTYALLFLAEYYLHTGDSQVVPGIQSFTLKLAQSQSIYGTYGHGPSAWFTDGSGRLVSTGYGPVNAVGGTAAVALVMGKKALVAAGQPIAPEIDTAIQRASNFFAFYVNKGGIPYGEHEPVVSFHASNGKDAMPAVFFGLQTGRVAETEYFSRLSIAGWIGREYGHTGQGLSYYWTALGALMGGPDAASEHLKPVRWHLDLSRRTDGSFAYDGQEQYGPGTTQGNTYLGAADYGGMSANAMYLLTYSLPLQRLYITGKNADPSHTLDNSTIAQAVSAGSFRLDRGNKSIPELFTAIGDFDPIVRNYASIELASRSLSGTDLTNLRNLLASPDPNLRQSASQTLGLRQDSTALPTIVSLLNDSDIWVRAKAAIAIRAYSSAAASTHRDAMMTAFIANATDPQIIDWNDPLQMSNGKLSLAIFGNAVSDGTPGNDIAAYTSNAPKESLLYPALRVGLQQPDSYPRLGVARFARERLPLADVQAIYPNVEEVAAYDTPADRMWSGDNRLEAIRLMGNLKITEGIPVALSMLEVPYDFAWGSTPFMVEALNVLASYGDAARYTLPKLREYLTLWNPNSDEYTALVNTIETLEYAITAPTQHPGLCVAQSQVVTTTGATAITLGGASPRGAFSFTNVTQPAHGTLTGTAPNLTYTPNVGYTGPDQFTFQTTDTLTTSTVATVGIVVGPSGNGVNGDYFNNIDFTNFVLSRTDPQINFDWGTGSPHPSIGPDTFSVRWSGVLFVPESGTYTFSALTSDGVRLYVNGQLVIDRFVDQSTKWTDGSPVYLTAGQYADIYLEYYENTGDAVAKLKWTGPGFAGDNGDIIPQAYLFDGSNISNRPVYAFPQNLTANLNTPLPISLSGTGGTLTYTILTQPASGTLSGTAPQVTYTPNNNFSGNDSFTFIVNNGTNNSLPATVSINVQAGPLATYTWASAVSGNWSEAARWTPSLPAATGQPFYALNFTTPGTYTATQNLNNGFQLNQLNMAAHVTLNGTQSISFVANGGTLPQWSQNGGDAVTVNHPVSLQAMTTMGGSGSGDMMLNGAISGAGGIIKNSPSVLEINENNSYSGGTTINAGTLRMANQKDGALGTGTVTLNGGTLHMDRINTANPLTVNGGRLWADGGWGCTWSGPVTLKGDLTVFVYPWDRVFINGNITGPGGLIAEGYFSSPESYNGIFLSGTNTYTGKTTIKDGMLLHCSSPASLGSGALEISSGGKLDLNFTGTRVVTSLTLDGVSMPAGTYGSTASPAANQIDAYFTGNGTVTVQPTTTALALTGGTTPANPGDSLTFTATVTGSTPTGNVEFFSGTTPLGSSALNGSFQASLTTTQLAIGIHSITARYVGNSSNSPSTSTSVVVEINNTTVAPPTGLSATPADPNINLSWTASPGATGYYVKRSTTSGGPYTVMALLAGTSWQDNSPLDGVIYHYVVTALNAAGESADSNEASAFIGSPSATTTTLSATPVATAVYGTPITFTATVTAGTGTPTGTVTFRSGSNIIGTGNLSSGTATLNLGTLPVATHSITASYEGSHDPSTSSALSYEITPKALTITGVSAASKVYDGTATATLSDGTLSGVVGGETVTLVAGSGTFANANVGTWAVTASGYALGGTDAANYTLTAQPTVPNATISARPIHITGTRTYDGTTAAPLGILTIANNVDGENLSLTGTAELTGKDAGDHPLAAGGGGGTLARIQHATAATSGNNNTLGATLTSAPTNGNTLIAVVSTRGTSANRISSITGGGATWSRVSQATNTNGSTTEIWVGPNASNGGTAITINAAESLRLAAVVMEYSGLIVPTSFDVAANNTGSGTSASTGTTTATSQASQLWIGGIGAASSTPTLGTITNSFAAIADAATSGGGNASTQTKTFALERIATTTGAATTGGTLSASVQWSGSIATFNAAAPGSSLALSGSAAGNYTLTGMTSAVTVNPKPLMVSGLSASDKIYDGTTAATLSGTAALLATQDPGSGTTADGKPYSGDEISLGGSPTGGSFATKHVGTNKPVTGVTGLTLGGAQAGNYTLVPLGTLTANITQLPVTVAAVAETKIYDGTTTAFNTPTLTPALATGDTATVLSQSYQTKSAGDSNKTLIPTITIDDGNGGNNYAVTLTNITTGTIAPKEITVAAVNTTKTYDGTTTASGTPTITPSLAPGDTTSVLSQSFDTPTAGTGNKIIIPSITINDGDNGNNYDVTLVNFTTGTIHKAAATVTLGNLSHIYDGTPKSATVTTDPAGLAYSVTYNGSPSEPTDGGTYAVLATVTDANYAGSASDNLVIAYSISYIGNGNTSGTAPASQTKFQDVDLTLATNSGNLEKTGFTFDGWNTAADGSGTSYPAGATYSGNASLTLYARWGTGADGTWIQTDAGPFNWSDPANWSDGIVATGPDRTAFFTPDITAAQVVNLDAPRTIGNITFTDSTTNNHNLTISGANVLTLSRSSETPLIDVTQSNRTLTIASQISGSNGLQKNGPGTLTLSGANDYTGGTTLNDGTVVLSNATGFGAGGVSVTGASRINASGAVSYANAIDVGATLTLQVPSSGATTATFSGVLSGSNDIHLLNSVSGNNQVNLDFTNTGNTYTGSVIGATGNANGADYFRFASLGDGGTFTFNKSGNRGGVAYIGASDIEFGVRQIALGTSFGGGGLYGFNGNGIPQNAFQNNGTGTVTFTSDMAMTSIASNSVFHFDGTNTGNNTFAGIIGDPTGAQTLGIAKSGTGKWVLTGANSFEGNSFVLNGTLSVNTISNAGAEQALGRGSLIYFGNTGTTGTLEFTGSANSTTDKQILIGSTIANASHTGSGVILNNGNGSLTFSNSVFNQAVATAIAARSITLGGSNTGANEIQGTIQNNAVASATVGVTVSGSTWILSGDNTYTGTTSVTAGKLFLNGDQSLATGNISVSADATLGGSGTLGGNATINANGRLEFDLSTPAEDHNPLELVAGKGLTFSGASTLIITSSGGASPGIYTLITGGNNIMNSAPSTLVLPSGWAATVSISGNNLLLNVTATGGPGPVDHFVISSIPSPQTVGTAITGITITAQDAANQTATSFTGTVTFGGTAGITGTSANFVEGVLSGVSVTPTLVGTDRTLTVTDGEGHTGAATFTVQSLFAAWAAENGLSDLDEPPNDGQLTNLQKFAFGTDPSVANSGPIVFEADGSVITPGTPVALNLLEGHGVDFRAVFGRRKNHQAAGLVYTVEFSANLSNWVVSTAVPNVLTGPENESDVDAVSVPYPLYIPTPNGYEKPKFFRVGVSMD